MQTVVVLSLGTDVDRLGCELAWRQDGSYSIRRDMVLAFMQIVVVLSLGIDVGRLLCVLARFSQTGDRFVLWRNDNSASAAGMA